MLCIINAPSQGFIETMLNRKNNTKAATNGYFQYQIIKRFIFKTIKCPNKSEKNLYHMFPEHKVASSKCPVLTNQQSKNQRYSVYSDINQTMMSKPSLISLVTPVLLLLRHVKIRKKKRVYIMNTLADVNTLCVNVGGRLSWELEDSCCSGSHGSRRCTPGSSSQPSQQDMGQDLAVLGLEEHAQERDQR